MAQAKQFDPSKYTTGEDRYVRFAEDFLEVDVTESQKRILRSVAKNKRTFVQSGNGVGKSYIAAVLNLAFLLTNPDSTNMATSGTYSVLSDVLWKPMQGIFKSVQEVYDLPGRCLQSPPRLQIDDEWYFKAVSPSHPDNLEGRHAGTMLITMEECDKPDITQEHFDSAGSMITSQEDRFLAIANPPRDEANVAYEKKTSPRWNAIQFSSFESHNVKVDAGEKDAEKIPGLVDLLTIVADWEAWNDEPWPLIEDEYDGPGSYPGFAELDNRIADEEDSLDRETVLEWVRPGVPVAKNSDKRDDLDERWYRRRLGIIPPAGSASHRPIYTEHVKQANDIYKNKIRDGSSDDDAPIIPDVRRGIGVDIGHEGGDRTAILERRGPLLDVWAVETVDHHQQNKRLIRHAIEAAPLSGACVIDAIGEGSGAADDITREYSSAYRFKASKNPTDPNEYANMITEAYDMLGRFLRDGGIVKNEKLLEELYAAARTMEFDERRRHQGMVLIASKEPVRNRLGRSPDLLDAAAMAIWASEVDAPSHAGGGRSRMFETDPW